MFEEEEDEEFLLEAKYPRPRLEKGFPCFVVVDNIPVIPAAKFPKLTNILYQLFSAIGSIVQGGIEIPADEEGNSLGYCFIEYESAKSAQLAKQQYDNHQLDKKHIFRVSTFEETDKIFSVPDEYSPPHLKDFEPREDPYWWLQENLLEDQFVIRQAEDTEVYWFSKKNVDLVIKNKNWTELYLAWSPHGSYLTTFHFKGIIIWSGKQWKRTKQFEHPGVKFIDFSPLEKYLVTFSPPQAGSRPESETLILWDVMSGQKVRGLSTAETEWPLLKWSPDDRYCARLSAGQVSVFKLPKVEPYFKIKVKDVRYFSWSPKDNFVALWTAEVGNTPARVFVFDVDQKKDIKQKNLFGLPEIKFHWHPEGTFLCVQADRHSKTKRSQISNFEIFFLKEKDIPVEVVENKNQVNAFAWEPQNRNRFAVIQIAEGSQKPDICFFDITGTSCSLSFKIEKTQATKLFWSPKGRFIVFMALKSVNVTLDFFDANNLELFNSVEHYGATDVEWDPSGLFLATSASAWKHQVENGYRIWSFSGRLLVKCLKEKFYQFAWRPRPPFLLPPEKINQIKKNLPRNIKKYSEEERMKTEERRKENQKQRAQLQAKFDKAKISTSTQKSSPDFNENDVQDAYFEEVIEQDSEVVLENQ